MLTNRGFQAQVQTEYSPVELAFLPTFAGKTHEKETNHNTNERKHQKEDNDVGNGLNNQT